MDAASQTWPPPAPSPPPFSSRPRASPSPHRRHSKRQHKAAPQPPSPPAPAPQGADFSALPPELVHRALAAACASDVSAASRACRAWRDALRPLREAAAMHAYGRRVKHGPVAGAAARGGVVGGGRHEAERQRALGLFRRAARLGSAAAMVDAGLMCWEEGRREEAVEYYRNAAELGHPVGMCNLGVSYLEADPPKAEEAIRWFYPSASAGNARAQYNLGLCLQNGKGIKRNQKEATGDKVKSLTYLELATRRGESAAAHMRDVILESLNAGNAQRALADADKWKPRALHPRSSLELKTAETKAKPQAHRPVGRPHGPQASRQATRPTGSNEAVPGISASIVSLPAAPLPSPGSPLQLFGSSAPPAAALVRYRPPPWRLAAAAASGLRCSGTGTPPPLYPARTPSLAPATSTAPLWSGVTSSMLSSKLSGVRSPCKHLSNSNCTSRISSSNVASAMASCQQPTLINTKECKRQREKVCRPTNLLAPAFPSDSASASASASAATVLSILHGAEPDRLLPAASIAPTPTILQHLRPALPTVPNLAIPALACWAGAANTVSLLVSCGLFATAWRFLLLQSPPSPSLPLSAFASLLRRYARLGRTTAAIRAFHFLHRHPDRYTVVDDGNVKDGSSSTTEVCPLILAVDALCKEGHPRAATQLVEQLRREDPDWAPDVRTYNVLLNGWSRARRLDKVEKLWVAMRHAGVQPTVFTYGTLIDAHCVMRRPDQAMELLDQMREEGIEANLLTCNPIVYALAQAGRFGDAHKVLEKFPLYGVAPNISTFNSLVLGYCKHGDLAGASRVLKVMMGRGISPTARTYNYFFMVFARNCSVELGMNLYSKMVNNGYTPDRLTYHLLIKMLCEANRLELTLQMLQEMRNSDFEPDLATSTMLIHLLCRRHQFEEAFAEFEHMFERGVVPQYITYRMLMKELKRLGLVKLVQKLTDLMRSVPHSTKLPGSYRDKEGDEAIEKKKSILQKAQVVSDVLKERKDPKKAHMLKNPEETDVEIADRIVANIRRRVYGDVSRTGPSVS
nr:unnamed protein product [Digitaria exilis]